MRIQKPVRGCLAFLALCFGVCSSLGQWATQQITLNPGWNAVYLEVQPEPDDCDAVFAAVPVEVRLAEIYRGVTFPEVHLRPVGPPE